MEIRVQDRSQKGRAEKRVKKRQQEEQTDWEHKFGIEQLSCWRSWKSAATTVEGGGIVAEGL